MLPTSQLIPTARVSAAWAAARDNPPPERLNLANNLFALCIQSKFQKEAYEHLGDRFLGINATHNVTQYKGIQLFTLMAWDNWGHGM